MFKELLFFILIPVSIPGLFWCVRLHPKADRYDRTDSWRFVSTLLVSFYLVLLGLFMLVSRVDARSYIIASQSAQQDLDRARAQNRELELAAIQQSVVDFNARLRRHQYWAARYPLMRGPNWVDIRTVE
jgi:hypothetical protein